MKSSSIKLMLNGELPYKDFKLIISKEMGEYLSGGKERGKSRPVYLDEDVDLFIGERDLKALCEAFLNGFLDESEINYTADAILLSNRVTFESESVSDRIGFLTDPEINGSLSKENIEKLMQP